MLAALRIEIDTSKMHFLHAMGCKRGGAWALLFTLTPALAALGNLLFFHISEPFIPHPHTLAHHVDATLLLLGPGMGGGVGC